MSKLERYTKIIEDLNSRGAEIHSIIAYDGCSLRYIEYDNDGNVSFISDPIKTGLSINKKAEGGGFYKLSNIFLEEKKEAS